MSGKIIEFKSLGNDLYSKDIYCKCPHHLFIGTDVEDIMKREIKLKGYNDSNFFDVVNANPRHYECKGCGYNFDYRWTRDGIEISNEEYREVTDTTGE